jgi:hypothetical protein
MTTTKLYDALNRLYDTKSAVNGLTPAQVRYGYLYNTASPRERSSRKASQPPQNQNPGLDSARDGGFSHGAGQRTRATQANGSFWDLPRERITPEFASEPKGRSRTSLITRRAICFSHRVNTYDYLGQVTSGKHRWVDSSLARPVRYYEPIQLRVRSTQSRGRKLLRGADRGFEAAIWRTSIRGSAIHEESASFRVDLL